MNETLVPHRALILVRVKLWFMIAQIGIKFMYSGQLHGGEIIQKHSSILNLEWFNTGFMQPWWRIGISRESFQSDIRVYKVLSEIYRTVGHKRTAEKRGKSIW